MTSPWGTPVATPALAPGPTPSVGDDRDDVDLDPCAHRDEAGEHARARDLGHKVSLHDAVDGVEVAEIKSRTLALLSNGTKVDIVARILRMRDAAFAARDLVPGRAIDRADLELKRVEMAEDERPAELGALIGAVPAVRIRQGAAVAVSDLRLKAVVKKGDLVRAVASGYEVDVRALEDGAPGQEIGVEFVSSRNRIRARVAGASRVDVVEASR